MCPERVPLATLKLLESPVCILLSPSWADGSGQRTASNQSRPRLFPVGGSMSFLVQEINGGERLAHKTALSPSDVSLLVNISRSSGLL